MHLYSRAYIASALNSRTLSLHERWRAHERYQPPEQSVVGMDQNELFDRPRAPWRLQIRLLRAEAMEALLYGCMTYAPRREHYRLLRRTHHWLLLRVIKYRRERGTYRQLSYVQALKDWVPKRGSHHPTTATSVRGSHGQTTCRAPPEAADGRKTSRGGGGEDPGKGRPEQNWLDCLKGDFQAFGATDGFTVDNRLTFGVI